MMRRTHGSVLEDDQEAGVVLPLYLEPTADALPVGERSLYVLGLELLCEAGEGENASHRGRKTRGGSRGHDLTRAALGSEREERVCSGRN